MGVVNVTPDSFSDGGKWFGPDAAIAHGRELAAAGADIVDVGGESTRPGALRISEEEELRRVAPVVAALAGAGLVVSIDTMRVRVAERALADGARLVNDVSGGLADPGMAGLIAAAGVPTWSCTGVATAPTCRTGQVTPTSSRKWSASFPTG
jgi:dihydropteroate synthase